MAADLGVTQSANFIHSVHQVRPQGLLTSFKVGLWAANVLPIVDRSLNYISLEKQTNSQPLSQITVKLGEVKTEGGCCLKVTNICWLRLHTLVLLGLFFGLCAFKLNCFYTMCCFSRSNIKTFSSFRSWVLWLCFWSFHICQRYLLLLKFSLDRNLL